MKNLLLTTINFDGEKIPENKEEGEKERGLRYVKVAILAQELYNIMLHTEIVP